MAHLGISGARLLKKSSLRAIFIASPTGTLVYKRFTSKDTVCLSPSRLRESKVFLGSCALVSMFAPGRENGAGNLFKFS